MEMKILSMRMDSETAKKFKVKCKEEKTSMNRVLGKLVKEYVETETRAEPAVETATAN